MITHQFFEKFNGYDTYLYLLSDKIDVIVCTLGATVLSVRVPNRFGEKTDVALGPPTVEDMLTKSDYMGSVIGRCANRIANGVFTLNDVTYNLSKNSGEQHLHGGNAGFDKHIFEATVEGDSLILETVSLDGDEGYPGRLKMGVKYTVKGSTLAIEYFGECDKDRLFNPTNHLYFNLNGEEDGSILDNVLQINSDSFLEVDQNLIPTVKSNVEGTPFDFTQAKPIGQNIDDDNVQLRLAGGYDHNYCLEDNHAATAYSVKSGICMDVFTDCHGIQFYSGNFLKGQEGKSVYNKRSGFCLETQFCPNAVNRDDCDKPILKAGEKHHTETQYVFTLL